MSGIPLPSSADMSLLEYPKTALEALLTPYAGRLPASVQKIYIQAVPKTFSAWAVDVTSSWTQDRKIEMEFMIEQVVQWIDPFRFSTDLEIQERAVGFHQIFLKIQQEIHEAPIPERHDYQDEATQGWHASRPESTFQCLSDLAALFADLELNPVNAKAQRKVPIPEGLDLQTSLSAAPQYLSWPDDNLDEEPEIPKRRAPIDPVVIERRRQEHLDRVRDDPFYILGDNRVAASGSATPISGEDDFDSIPIVQFDGGTNLLAPASKVRKKKKKAREIVLDDTPVDIAVDEMPENATLSDSEMNGQSKNRKVGGSVLSNKQAKGLEDIDFEEEERVEREAVEAERLARQNRSAAVVEEKDVPEEPLIVERIKKKKKKEGATDGSKKVKKKKEKGVVET
jgi:AP-3 complex subunit delta